MLTWRFALQPWSSAGFKKAIPFQFVQAFLVKRTETTMSEPLLRADAVRPKAALVYFSSNSFSILTAPVCPDLPIFRVTYTGRGHESAATRRLHVKSYQHIAPTTEVYCVTIDKPTSHIIITQSSVYIRVHSWSCTLYGFGQMDNGVDPPLQYQTKHFHCAKNHLLHLSIPPPILPLVTTDLFFCLQSSAFSRT